jgi:hypothetical protein
MHNNNAAGKLTVWDARNGLVAPASRTRGWKKASSAELGIEKSLRLYAEAGCSK